MNIIDMHCDTILQSYLTEKDLYHFDEHINIEKLKKGGSLAQCFALFIAQQKEAEECNIKLGSYDLFHALLDTFKKNMELASKDIKQVRNKKELLDNANEGKLSAILTVEDGTFIEGKYERLDEMISEGVKLLALTWNYENCFGYPNSIDPEKHMLGLKPFGKEAIKYLNENDVLVDVSHLSEGGFWDVVENSKTTHEPFVASHSCSRALCNHSRNLTDAQLKALADCGGVAGVNFYSAFLKEGSEISTIDDIVLHLRHMKDVCGVDSIGFGSDFDGITCSLEYKDFSGFPLILEAMQKYFTDDEIDKIGNKNFLRIFR